jgi:hypothetical protein
VTVKVTYSWRCVSKCDAGAVGDEKADLHARKHTEATGHATVTWATPVRP